MRDIRRAQREPRAETPPACLVQRAAVSEIGASDHRGARSVSAGLSGAFIVPGAWNFERAQVRHCLVPQQVRRIVPGRWAVYAAQQVPVSARPAGCLRQHRAKVRYVEHTYYNSSNYLTSYYFLLQITILFIALCFPVTNCLVHLYSTLLKQQAGPSQDRGFSNLHRQPAEQPSLPLQHQHQHQHVCAQCWHQQ